MGIPLVVTRGYGNGTFSGTITDVTLRGYGFGAGAEPEAEVEAVEAAAADRGFGKFMEEFARERLLERRARENEEIMRIACMEEEFLISLIKKLI